MLANLLGSKIHIIQSAKDWKDAIRISAQPLLDNDSIEDRYVDAMIDICEKYDGYIVLADLFAMPHARPEDGVKKMDAALTISRTPIDFLGKPVQILLAIAPIDSNAHIGMLKEISELLGDSGKADELISAETVEEISEIIKTALT